MQDVLEALLPYPLYALLSEKKDAEELRLSLGSRVILKSGGRVEASPLICTKELLKETLDRMLNRSFYAHEDSIREGYISLPCGLRAGLCGQAVVDGGKIKTVKEITSIVLRIPHRIRGVEKPLFEALEKEGFTQGLLIYSLPGVGKTTVLRELAYRIGATGSKSLALIDTRGELSAGIENCDGISVFLHYPKAAGASIAVRTMSPDIIVLDEIGPEECPALIEAGFGGVTALASCHAATLEELRRRPGFAKLLSSGIFRHIVRLSRKGNDLSVRFEKEVEDSDV